jgi:hypothetical protein
MALVQQHVLGYIQAKRAKFVARLRLVAHKARWNSFGANLELFWNFLKGLSGCRPSIFRRELSFTDEVVWLEVLAPVPF